jgi:hypothetical protein
MTIEELRATMFQGFIGWFCTGWDRNVRRVFKSEVQNEAARFAVTYLLNNYPEVSKEIIQAIRAMPEE